MDMNNSRGMKPPMGGMSAPQNGAPSPQGGAPAPQGAQPAARGPEMALLQRAASRLAPEELQYLDQIIDDNPTLGVVIFKMFPGLASLFDAAGLGANGSGGGQPPQPSMGGGALSKFRS